MSATIGNINLDDLVKAVRFLHCKVTGFFFFLFCTVSVRRIPSYTEGEGNRDLPPGERSITEFVDIY